MITLLALIFAALWLAASVSFIIWLSLDDVCEAAERIFNRLFPDNVDHHNLPNNQ